MARVAPPEVGQKGEAGAALGRPGRRRKEERITPARADQPVSSNSTPTTSPPASRTARAMAWAATRAAQIFAFEYHMDSLTSRQTPALAAAPQRRCKCDHLGSGGGTAGQVQPERDAVPAGRLPAIQPAGRDHLDAALSLDFAR